MARRRTPPEWQELMDRAGVPSIRRLADRMGRVHTGVTRIIHGEVTPDDETVAALADALRVPMKTIYQLTGRSHVEGRRWTPPAEVQRLSKREQDALTEMIRAMAAGRDQEEVTGNAEHPAPMNQADHQSATNHAARYGLAAHPEEDIPGDALPEDGP